MKQQIQKTLRSHGVEGKITGKSEGPVVTTYEFEPAEGTKVSSIRNRIDELKLSLGAESLRIIAPIPGRHVVGIEVSNRDRELVSFSDVTEHYHGDNSLPLYIGADTDGKNVVKDLSEMPHLLVAGATGSGKSVTIHSMITGLFSSLSPKQVQFVLIDPKRLEMSIYSDLPHLLHEPIYEPDRTEQILDWLLGEMSRRYKALSNKGLRDIGQHNDNCNDTIPRIVVVIDEFADLLISGSDKSEDCLRRLAQKARAAGIHLLISTQRPSAKIIDGAIRSNFPARIALRVSSGSNSRIILGEKGANNLLGNGDMLIKTPRSKSLTRAHGSFISTERVNKLIGRARQNYDNVERIELEPEIDFTNGMAEKVDVPETTTHTEYVDWSKYGWSDLLAFVFCAFLFWYWCIVVPSYL